ncbi:MAG: 3-phosphoshikimate 1-carboxyvinyltransferase [Bacteroidetes bacterium HGW-Bacteroidetes-6]|jgi:3-phosphoshikimate 1-carboxyvinyltransferase|nr:MAG: 3-phosphoshikimate 1-carboxyvinyltransferase [Bacteroidetes bacterium HGW-Bacteroidetes-6]
MNKSISPYKIQGTVKAPASKSYLQRALAIASLAQGKSVLKNGSFSSDVDAVIGIIQTLGSKIEFSNNWTISPGKRNELENIVLNAGESGLALRMFSSIAALYNGYVEISGSGTLLDRPITPIIEALNAAGIQVVAKNHKLPLTINGTFQNNKIAFDSSFSSQILTGLLIAAPLLEHDTEIIVSNLVSRPYVEMTIDIMRHFGAIVKNDHFERFYIQGNQHYWGCEYDVESDWSAAANFLVTAAVSGSISVVGLNSNSLQADRAIMKALALFGAEIEIQSNSIFVKQHQKKPFVFDATDCPDLFPPLVVLAAAANGRSVISGTHRLIHKESNRLETLTHLFSKLGLKMETEDNNLIIHGSGKLKGALVDSYGDHRLAMCAAVAATLTDLPVEISNTDVVGKSYPDFFKNLLKQSVPT